MAGWHETFEKFEFASPEWVHMLRDLIVEGLAGKDLSGIEFTLCKEYTAPPAHLRRPGSDTIGWLTDITEHPTAEGKLYLCAVKDVCSNRIVGYSMDARMTAALAVSALRNAIALRSPARTIVYSDRGSSDPMCSCRPCATTA